MEKTKIRNAAAAGQFYPASARELRSQIEGLIDKNAAKSDIVACMLPHAGYIYSGSIAAQTISRINIKDKVILLGPNHTGYGAAYSIMPEGSWQTPLGEVEIEPDLAKKLLARCRYLESDSTAHTYEHSLEVELPFLQYFKEGFKIVPIVFLAGELDALKKIGEEIADTIKGEGQENSTIIIASSDMTHYEPQEEALRKDREAIQAIIELNENKLIGAIKRLNISMCGYAPVIAMISAAKRLGARNAKLIKYQTSGDVTGDKNSVVGYAGIIIY